MDKFVDENLERFGKAGDAFGQFLRNFFSKTKNGFLVVGILSLVGLVVFLWGVFDGARKKR
jgi:hypothetical protein